MPEAKSGTLPRAPLPANVAGSSARNRALSPLSHDAVLRVRILDQLWADPQLDSSDLSVVVRNRSATLFGSVRNESQRARAQQLATEISGIIEVTNRLRAMAPKETT
jgi:osmotically-inducible protein OsmY